MRCWRSLVDHGSRAPVTRDEGYVALQAWLVGQLNPRAPHAADLFAQDRECLYAAFLSVSLVRGWDSPTSTTIVPIMGSTPSIFSSETSRHRLVVGE